MTALLGKGMDAADKKTQEFRLQSELGRIGSSKEKALAELGRAILAKEGGNSAFVSAFADQIKAIGDFEAQEEALRKRIEALQSSNVLVSGVAMQTANAAVQGHSCPACGSPVALEAMFCPACGDNLAVLKSQFKKCPNCNIYYSDESAFCEKCGSKTVQLEIAHAASAPVADSASDANGEDGGAPSPLSGDLVADVAEEGKCPHCGATLRPGAAFCGACGTSL